MLAVAGLKEKRGTSPSPRQEAATHRNFCPYKIATVDASPGNNDTVHQLFRKGTHEHADCMARLGVEPCLDTFHFDPQYGQPLRRIGLTPAR